MSNRYQDYNKGSSRSTRDDSRTQYGGLEDDDFKERHRSRSPRSYHTSSGSSKHSRDRTRSRSPNRHLDREEKYHDKSNDWESDEEVPAPPPPPRISKISMGFSKPNAPIKMNLGGASKAGAPVKPKPTVASVFNNDDDDDEPEEMPAEAKMRMRNIGRETPTSAGPNSFGKTKQGFCDSKKVFEKNMKQAMESEEKPAASMKLPQTIYKIKGP